MSNKKGNNSFSLTPKSAKKAGGVATPLGNKRPREEEEDDSSIDEELAATLLNSKKVKKLKQMIAEDGDHSEEEEEEEEDDDSDDDEDDSDDQSDEDDEEDDGDSEQEFPEKVVKKSKQTPKQPEQKQPKISPAKTIEAPTRFKASAANVVLFNLPRLQEDELRGFLTKRGVQPESVSCITAPAALIGLPNEAAAKKAISACSGSAYGLKTLAAISVSGDVSKIQTNKNPNPSSPDAPLTCVLATFIPKSVTEQDILKMIGIKPKNVHLITRGPKNTVSNACYIDCNNEADAKKVYETLQGKEIENSRLKVHLKPQQNYSPVNEKSFVVTNVPFTAGVEEMKKEFPTASQIDATHKGSFLVQFNTAEAKLKAAQGARGKSMGGRALRIVTSERSDADFSIFIANLPFQVKTEDVRAVFPKSNRIHLQLGKNGKCNGTAIVYFPTQEAADESKKEVSSKQLQGRTLRLKDDIEKAPAAAKAPKDTEEAAKPPKKKAELPAQVGSESEDEDDEDDAEEGSEDSEGEEEGSEEEGSDGEDGDSDDDENEGSEEEADDKDDSDEAPPPAKKAKPQSPGEDRGRGGFKPFNNGGRFQRGAGKFQPRGGRGGGFNPRGGRGGSGGFRGGNGNFRGGRGRGGTPNRGGRGFKRN